VYCSRIFQCVKIIVNSFVTLKMKFIFRFLVLSLSLVLNFGQSNSFHIPYSGNCNVLIIYDKLFLHGPISESSVTLISNVPTSAKNLTTKLKISPFVSPKYQVTGYFKNPKCFLVITRFETSNSPRNEIVESLIDFELKDKSLAEYNKASRKRSYLNYPMFFLHRNIERKQIRNAWQLASRIFQADAWYFFHPRPIFFLHFTWIDQTPSENLFEMISSSVPSNVDLPNFSLVEKSRPQNNEDLFPFEIPMRNWSVVCIYCPRSYAIYCPVSGKLSSFEILLYAYELATDDLYTRKFGFLLEQQSSHYFANVKMMSDFPIPFRWPNDLSNYNKGRFITNEQIVLFHLMAVVNTTIPRPGRLYDFSMCDEYAYAYGYRNCRFPLIYPNYRVSMRPHHEIELGINSTVVTRLQSDTYFISTGSGAFKFLTCFAAKSYTISTYTKPLQIAVWIALLPFTAFLTLFVLFVGKLKSFTNPPWLFFYSTLLEHSLNVPEYIAKTTWFKLLTLSWLLAALVLSNGYKGVGISSITAPLSLQSIRNFMDMVRLLNRTNVDHSFGNSLSSFQKKASKFVVLSNVVQGGAFNFNYIDLFLSFSFFLRVAQNTMYYRQTEDTIEYMNDRYLNLLLNCRHRLPKRLDKLLEMTHKSVNIIENVTEGFYEAMEEELTQCDRTVYVADEKTISLEFDYLSRVYEEIEFFIGDETMGNQVVGWFFRSSGGSKAPQKLHLLLQAGILNEFNALFNSYKYSLRRKYSMNRTRGNLGKPKIEPIFIHGNIQTIFYAYLIGCIVCSASILLERTTKFLRCRWVVYRAIIIRLLNYNIRQVLKMLL